MTKLVFCQKSCFFGPTILKNPNRNDITDGTELGTCYESKGSHSKTFWIYFTLRMVFQVFICWILIQYPLLTLWVHFLGSFFTIWCYLWNFHFFWLKNVTSDSKKTWTNCSTVSLVWFVHFFLNQTLNEDSGLRLECY